MVTTQTATSRIATRRHGISRNQKFTAADSDNRADRVVARVGTVAMRVGYNRYSRETSDPPLRELAAMQAERIKQTPNDKKPNAVLPS